MLCVIPFKVMSKLTMNICMLPVVSVISACLITLVITLYVGKKRIGKFDYYMIIFNTLIISVFFLILGLYTDTILSAVSLTAAGALSVFQPMISEGYLISFMEGIEPSTGGAGSSSGGAPGTSSSGAENRSPSGARSRSPSGAGSNSQTTGLSVVERKSRDPFYQLIGGD